jgi:hypothetical protein
VPKGTLRILERSMVLQIGSQCPPHHLEGEEALRDLQPLSDRPNPL